MSDRLGRILAIFRALKSAEKEQLVPNDSAADGRAVLVTLQCVGPGRRKEVARVEVAVSDVFEQISVEIVRPGLGDHVDGGAGMRSEARGHGAGLDAEL